jgi:hypothetical protein
MLKKPSHMPAPSRHWTPLWNETDAELIAAALSLENASPLLIELAVRLEEKQEKTYVPRS